MNSQRSVLALVVLVTLSLALLSCVRESAPPIPKTETRAVTEVYHGTTVIDDYRWLDNLKDPAVRAWNDEQNLYARSVIDRFPDWEKIYSRLKGLYEDTTAQYYGFIDRQKFFAMKTQPPKNQPFLVVQQSPTDLQSERVVVDPNVLDSTGSTTIDWYRPSWDGKLVAVSLSVGGSEDGSAHIFEVETGKKLSDIVPRVQYPTGAGDLEWNTDNSGFYYTRYPQGSERPPEDANFYQQVYFHKLGTPASDDRYVVGKEFPRIAEIELSASADKSYLLATVANGDGGDFIHFLRRPSGSWMQITTYEDQIKDVEFGSDGRLYMLSRLNASRGKIVAAPCAQPTAKNRVEIVAEGAASIQSFQVTKSRLYVETILGGPETVTLYDLKGVLVDTIPTEAISSIVGMTPLEGDQMLLGMQTYLTPIRYVVFDPASRAMTQTPLAPKPTVDYADAEVVREFVPSRDGTRVPINIVRKKGIALDGTHPVLLYGYGGYNASQTPYFSLSRRLWIDNGGVFVVANLRGGGEYGEEWHAAGKLTRKQNVFDDFLAAAEWLVANNYTSPSRLAIMGGSNGGLLMGAVLTQRPELFRAVVSSVGIYDMLRFELFPNGAFNVTEFGTVKNPEQFSALYAYSPYHHVVDGTRYPAVLMTTGDNDGRVDPANSRKMTARLQAATASGLPILLRTSSNAGHGIGTSLDEYISQQTDVWAFLFQQLGLHYQDPDAAAIH